MDKTTPPNWLTNSERARHVTKQVEVSLPLCFGYSRFSHIGQDPSSIDRQDESIVRTVKRFQLPPLQKIYSDYAQTGTNTDRAQYQELVRLLNENKGSYLVIEKVDRLLRSRSVLGALIQVIEKCDVQVFQEGGFVDPSFFPILGTIAVMNNEEWRSRARFRIDILKSEGVWMNPPPWGLKRKSKGIVVPDPYFVPHLTKIVEMFVEGASYRALARYLQDQGVPRPRDAKRWSPNVVKGILLNPIYCGWTPYSAVVK